MATKTVFNFMECVSQPPVIVDAFHSGMRVVKVGQDRIDHEWIELANVPQSLDEIFVSRERRQSTRHAALDLVMGLPSTPPGGRPTPPSAKKPLRRQQTVPASVSARRAQSSPE